MKTATPADQLFVISAISRAGIADDLNEHLGHHEFAVEDPRLTAELCTAYASHLGGVEAVEGSEDRDEELAELRDEFANLALTSPVSILGLPIV